MAVGHCSRFLSYAVPNLVPSAQAQRTDLQLWWRRVPACRSPSLRREVGWAHHCPATLALLRPGHHKRSDTQYTEPFP